MGSSTVLSGKRHPWNYLNHVEKLWKWTLLLTKCAGPLSDPLLYDSTAVDLYSFLYLYSSYVSFNTDWLLLIFLLFNVILFSLISEVEELTESIAALKKKLMESEQTLRNLEDTRMDLEKDIAVKKNSIFIDRQKCMAHRTRYPVALKLAGYQ